MVQFFSNKAKGRTSKRVFQENKARMLCFLETPVLRFVLLPYYRQIVTKQTAKVLNLTDLLTNSIFSS